MSRLLVDALSIKMRWLRRAERRLEVTLHVAASRIFDTAQNLCLFALAPQPLLTIFAACFPPIVFPTLPVADGYVSYRAISDEIYEHIRYAGGHHVLATWPGMRERTVTISGLSKTFSCTGWRLGYAIAPFEMSSPIRKVHDFLTVGAPAPLQAAGAIGMAFGAEYYNEMALEYRERRDMMVSALDEAAFKFSAPEGAYYILADFSAISDLRGVEFAMWLAKEIGVATVPGTSFYREPGLGEHVTRFAFCKKTETLEKAAERLAGIAAKV